MLSALVLLLLASASPQTVPAGWMIVKDSRGICRIAVPPDWTPLEENTGAAVLENTTKAIAVVTSQPEQSFKPLTDTLQKVLAIRKDKLFENSARRIFYQEKISKNADDPNAYSASVPGKAGTCSCHLTVLPSVPDETARKIALSLGPVAEE